MKSLAVASIACLFGLLTATEVRAQSARLEVKVLGDSAAESRLSQTVRNGTKVETTAPKLRIEATVLPMVKTPVAATVEWYVLGRLSEEGKQAGRTGSGLVIMQSSKEAVTATPPATRTTFYVVAPGQVKDGNRSEGWLVRLLTPDGRLMDAKGSGESFAAIGRNPAALNALIANKAAADTKASSGDVEIPLEVATRIKAEAEKNWPGNPEMQAVEIKSKTDAHKAAYRK